MSVATAMATAAQMEIPLFMAFTPTSLEGLVLLQVLHTALVLLPASDMNLVSDTAPVLHPVRLMASTPLIGKRSRRQIRLTR
jgi:hypothetical protein